MKRKILPWTPFKLADTVTVDSKLAQDPSYRKIAGLAIEKGEDIYVNSRYQVVRKEIKALDGGPSIVPLSLKNRDKSARHDWRDFQRIKNELVGEEWEAVEIYPAESRLVDTANQYHLWCLPFKLPFGFNERLVAEQSEDFGGVQRAFEQKPDDLVYIDRAKLLQLAREVVDSQME